jgi:hypothetical protein
MARRPTPRHRARPTCMRHRHICAEASRRGLGTTRVADTSLSGSSVSICLPAAVQHAPAHGTLSDHRAWRLLVEYTRTPPSSASTRPNTCDVHDC